MCMALLNAVTVCVCILKARWRLMVGVQTDSVRDVMSPRKMVGDA